MWQSGSSLRVVNIRIVDIGDSPVVDRVMSDWQVTFLRDGLACPDALQFENLGAGNYRVSYTPSGFGQDQLEIYDTAADLRFADIEDILNFGNTVTFTLDQNFGGADSLRVVLPGASKYRLLLFDSAGWDLARRSEADALAASGLGDDGRWLNPIRVAAGTYHVVATKPQSFTVVARYLKVGV